MSQIIGSIITDCADDNARARQELRFASLFGVKPTFLGVRAVAPDVEAAGNLIDQLGALTNLPASASHNEAIILVNVAPRGDKVKKKWNNGTPFCYFRIGNVLVVSTYAGRALSLAQEYGLVKSVELLDMPTVTAAAVKWGEITQNQAERINHTQFRSLEFLPLVAYWLTQKKPVPSKTQVLEEQHDIHGKVWCIDNFGNAKTTLRPEDIDFTEGKALALADGKLATCYRRLADVPKDTTALVIGSSGYQSNRFLEVVVQWQDNGFHGSDSAKIRHNLSVGSTVLGDELR
ncbi:MAG TPA: hypothetical protein VK497_03625 [Candidatus Saccharimonadales bacterium]|nr:hypothetical protein [Candidatus Saccharimonadales bacterium]